MSLTTMNEKVRSNDFSRSTAEAITTNFIFRGVIIMSIVWIVFGWIFALIFGLLTVSMLLLHNWLHALTLFLVVLLCLPPVNSLLKNSFNFTMHPLLRGVLIVVLLFVFGERDNLVGDPETARALVQDRQDVRVEVVEAGHLMGAELPGQVDNLIIAFFAEA